MKRHKFKRITDTMEQIKFSLDDLIKLLDIIPSINGTDQKAPEELFEPKFELLTSELIVFGFLEHTTFSLSKKELKIPKLSQKGFALRVSLDNRKNYEEISSIFPDGFTVGDFNSVYEKLLASQESGPTQQTINETTEVESDGASSTLLKSTSVSLTGRDAQVRIALRRKNLNFWWLNAHPGYWRMSRMRPFMLTHSSLYFHSQMLNKRR